MKESFAPFRMAVAASGGSGSATGKDILCCSELK
jgi:predicted PP-loop superfamily ATPase